MLGDPGHLVATKETLNKLRDDSFPLYSCIQVIPNVYVNAQMIFGFVEEMPLFVQEYSLIVDCDIVKDRLEKDLLAVEKIIEIQENYSETI
jgi:hypothetical protein